MKYLTVPGTCDMRKKPFIIVARYSMMIIFCCSQVSQVSSIDPFGQFSLFFCQNYCSHLVSGLTEHQMNFGF